MTPSTPSAGSVVGAPSAVRAQVSGIGSPRFFARYTFPRATAVFAMSTATTRPPGAGAAIDHGLVPSTFSRPPHGAIAGLALVVSTATQPSAAARRVKYMAVPKWLEWRAPATPTPCSRGAGAARQPAPPVGTPPQPPPPPG